MINLRALDEEKPDASIRLRLLRDEIQTVFKRLSTFIALVALAAGADASGALRADERDMLALAGIPVGMKHKSLRGDWQKLPGCTSDMTMPVALTYSCEFVNSHGTTVWIYGEEVESVTLTLGRYTGKLLANIDRKDSASSVMRKLRLVTGCKTCWQQVDFNDFGGVTVKSGLAFKSRQGRIFGVRIEFDQAGKMVRLQSRGDGF